MERASTAKACGWCVHKQNSGHFWSRLSQTGRLGSTDWISLTPLFRSNTTPFPLQSTTLRNMSTHWVLIWDVFNHIVIDLWSNAGVVVTKSGNPPTLTINIFAYWSDVWTDQYNLVPKSGKTCYCQNHCLNFQHTDMLHLVLPDALYYMYTDVQGTLKPILPLASVATVIWKYRQLPDLSLAMLWCCSHKDVSWALVQQFSGRHGHSSAAPILQQMKTNWSHEQHCIRNEI